MAFSDQLVVGPPGAEVSSSQFGEILKLLLNNLDGRDIDRLSEINGLSARLGSGVGTGSSTTTGTASAQLAALRTRAGALETLTPSTARFAHLVHTGRTTTPPANFAALCSTANTANAQLIQPNDTTTAARTLWMPAPTNEGGAITKSANNYEFTFGYTGYWMITANLGIVVRDVAATALLGQVQAALMTGSGTIELLNNDVLPANIPSRQAIYLPISGEIRVTSTTEPYYLRAYQTLYAAASGDNDTMVLDAVGGATYLKARFVRPL
ncbi:hypothetical protein [Prauserella endophytica]|uniref:Tail fiber protein n=1 Tax=Prauserella endophytica TaxID=1592324 RepID=A0ABY2S034_9PSEU|nr:hypothetical protein [Prauserella endophytica]PXY20306.1 hypothetical protein BAY59_31190 [Prauserella coralliicola]TKG66909.1 hypothetical protein FCN18_23635 [Prauserella endophytica]